MAPRELCLTLLDEGMKKTANRIIIDYSGSEALLDPVFQAIKQVLLKNLLNYTCDSHLLQHPAVLMRYIGVFLKYKPKVVAMNFNIFFIFVL